MAVVVDTDVISFFQKHDTRYELYLPHLVDTEKFILFMTLAELRRWTLERNWGERRKALFEEFLTENYGIVFADDLLCDIWAEIESDARRKGRPIDTADAWVASVALYFDIPLVTHNRRHFENVENLTIVSES